MNKPSPHAPTAPATARVDEGGEWPTIHKWTDLGNAERLSDSADGKLLWVYGLGWLCWDGRRWRRDESNWVLREATHTVRGIYGEAAFLKRAGGQGDR